MVKRNMKILYMEENMKNIKIQTQIDYISQLPKELKIHILSYLTPHDYSKLALMSHAWNKIVNEEILWENACIQNKIALTNIQLNSSDSQYLKRMNAYKRAYIIDYNVDKNWRSRKLTDPIQLRRHDEVISCLKFDDDYRILIGSYYLRLELWCLKTGILIKTFTGHTDIIWACLLFETIAISASADQTIRIWNIDTGETIHLLSGHSSTVRCLSMINNSTFVSGSGDNTLRIWDICEGKCVCVLVGHTKTVSCVCSDQNYIISGSYDFTIRIWDIKNNKFMYVLRGHSNRIFSLMFNGQHIVSASLDSNLILIWDVATGNCLREITGACSLQIKLRNEFLVTSSDSMVRIWPLKGSDRFSSITMENNFKTVSSVCCFVFDDNFLVSYSLDGYLKLFDMKNFKFIRNLLRISGGAAVWDLKIYRNKLFCVLVSPTVCSYGETKLICLDFEWPSKSSNEALLESCPIFKTGVLAY